MAGIMPSPRRLLAWVLRLIALGLSLFAEWLEGTDVDDDDGEVVI